MPGGESSSEEFVEDDSGGEEEEDEGDSSAYESEEESEDGDDDDDGATGDDSDVFETPIKARKRSRTPAQQPQLQSAAASGKNKRKSPADAATSASGANGSKKKKGPAATGPAASTKKATAGEGASPAAGAKGKGKGKGRGAAAATAAATGDGASPSQSGSSASPPPPGDGSQATPGGAGAAGRGGGGGKGSPAASAPHPPKSTSGGVVRAGAAAKVTPSKTPKVAVSDYMQQSNRPYSYINVFDNLRKKIPKAMIQKLLDELVRDGTLNVQEYGKAKIYYANQEALPNGAGDTSADKLRRLDLEAKSLTSQLETASKQEQQSRSRVSLLSSQPTDTALADKLDQSARDLEQAEARNAAAKGQGRSAVAGGMKAAKSDFNKFRALWVNRKRNAMDVVDMVADGMEKKPKVVMDELGVELDEEPVPAKM